MRPKCLAFDNRISKAFEILPLDFVRVEVRVQAPYLVRFPWLPQRALSHLSVSHRLDRANLRLGKLENSPWPADSVATLH